ncbi:MAG: hypothetical protein FJ356_00725 [Thaumarchaeota archaeon]|nr:hypothetical protein [Nitrososphaerota archaeon]
MEGRIKQEIEMLSKKYEVIQYDPNHQWVLIRYKLPPGWNMSETEILLLIPAGYPSTKPDNFYVPKGLKSANPTIQIQNYNENDHNYLGRQWGQFSFHVEEWKPSDDIVSGHNLLTFMMGIEQRLMEIF